jgi:predicted RND superfamily exporter protein
MTVLVVILAFITGRRGKLATVLVIGSLLAGMIWMTSLLAAEHAKINFLNFIAFPITLGVGVDYAINMVHRWRNLEPGQVFHLVRETGGAVVLCSLTTTLGYSALLQSVNPAVRSFGLAAVIGEITCLLTVVVFLPAVLVMVERSRRGLQS